VSIIKNNKKFWEELIVYFSFTVTLVSDGASRNKTLVCIHNEVNTTIQFGRLECWYYWLEWFMRYTVGMVSDGMIYTPSFMKTVDLFHHHNKTSVDFASHYLCKIGLLILICYMFWSIKDHHQANTHY
jgi:hypothetical protein